MQDEPCVNLGRIMIRECADQKRGKMRISTAHAPEITASVGGAPPERRTGAPAPRQLRAVRPRSSSSRSRVREAVRLCTCFASSKQRIEHMLEYILSY